MAYIYKVIIELVISVLKSDNANGLFSFEGPCEPARAQYENETITCSLTRDRGDDGTVTVAWVVEQYSQSSLVDAHADFTQSQGTVVFLPGQRKKVMWMSDWNKSGSFSYHISVHFGLTSQNVQII